MGSGGRGSSAWNPMGAVTGGTDHRGRPGPNPKVVRAVEAEVARRVRRLRVEPNDRVHCASDHRAGR